MHEPATVLTEGRKRRRKKGQIEIEGIDRMLNRGEQHTEDEEAAMIQDVLDPKKNKAREGFFEIFWEKKEIKK